MTIVKHSAFSTEVSKREVFWLPVFLIFQHSQLFSTFFFTVFQYFFHWIPAFLQALFSLNSYCVPALNTKKEEGLELICTHISIVFQRGACVSKPCIPALPAPLSSNPSPLKNVRCYCVPAFFTNNLTFWIYFKHFVLDCISIGCIIRVYFYYV